MNDKTRRKDLQAQYKQHHPEAAVYRFVNNANHKVLLGSSPNMPSIRNKLAFAKSTNTPSALDHRLNKDIRQFGIDVFSLEVLDVLETTPEMTAAEILAQLKTLEALWREQIDPGLLY